MKQLSNWLHIIVEGILRMPPIQNHQILDGIKLDDITVAPTVFTHTHFIGLPVIRVTKHQLELLPSHIMSQINAHTGQTAPDHHLRNDHKMRARKPQDLAALVGVVVDVRVLLLSVDIVVGPQILYCEPVCDASVRRMGSVLEFEVEYL